MILLAFGLMLAVVPEAHAAYPAQCGITDGGQSIRSDAECNVICDNIYSGAADCYNYCDTCESTQTTWGGYSYPLCLESDYDTLYYPDAVSTYPSVTNVVFLQTVALNSCHAQDTPAQCGVTDGGQTIRSDAECSVVCENDYDNSPACLRYCDTCDATQTTWGGYTYPLCEEPDYTSTFYPNALAQYPTVTNTVFLQTVALNSCHAQTAPAQCGVTDGGQTIRSDAECNVVCENDHNGSLACHNYCDTCDATQATWGGYAYPTCVYPDYQTTFYPNAVAQYPSVTNVVFLQTVALNSCHAQGITTGTG